MHALLFASLYVFVLSGHALYAYYVLRSGRSELTYAGGRGLKGVLVRLLLLNGISLLAFVYPREWWVWVHIASHGVMVVFETNALRHARVRWPFLINHFFYIWVLYLYLGTLIEGL